MRQRVTSTQCGEALYQDLPLTLRALRDLFSPEIDRIRIDAAETFKEAQQFAEGFMPECAARLEHYRGDRPLFDLFGVEDEIQKALDRKVPLKSGGYVIFDQAIKISKKPFSKPILKLHRP